MRISTVPIGYTCLQAVLPRPHLITPDTEEMIPFPVARGEIADVRVVCFEENTAVTPFALFTVKEQVLRSMVVHPHVHFTDVEFGPGVAVRVILVHSFTPICNGFERSTLIPFHKSHQSTTLSPDEAFLVNTCTL